MTPDLERRWALTKAELLDVQAAFLKIVIWRAKTFETLKTEIQMNIAELEKMAQEYRKEAAQYESDRN